jgi:CheY-like chemotaxis protein
MDNMMIPMNGVTATKEILKINPNIVIFGTTGLTGKKDVNDFMKAGAKKVYGKPLNFEDLIDELRKYHKN